MDALYEFVYAPPNERLAKRLAQMAELGGYESSPIHIASMASYALLLGTSTSTRSLEVCEDGDALRVVHGKGQPGHHATDKATERSDRCQQVTPVCRLTHAIMGDTPGAASFLAEGPLRTWLSDGCHTSLVCFGLSSTTRLTTRSSCNTSPDCATPPPGAMPTSQSARFIQPTVAVTAAVPAPTPIGDALPAALEILLGLERPSALLECLHAAFSGRAGASGVALWCFELYEASASSPTYSSHSIGDNVDDPGGGSSHRSSGDGAWRRGVVATRPGGGASGGGASRWRDLMAEAVAETVGQASQGSGTTSAASVGGGGARASAGGTSGCKARAQGMTRGSVGAAATPIAAVDGPVRAASVAEAIAALHAAFSRSSLWRRRDPSRHRPSPATVAAPGSLLEPAIRLGASTAAQIFVRLGVRLPSQTEKMHHQQHQQRAGAANGSGSAARGEAAQRVWTTLDLVFIGCDPPPPQQQPGAATTEDSDEGTGGPSPANGPSGPAAGGGGAGLALGQVRELLTELVARQDEETGIPRQLRCTSRPQSSGLCLRLAHLLAGNVAPHLLLVLPPSLPDAGENLERDQYVLDTLELFSRARAVRTVVTKSEPPPPLYGASLAESLASSSPRDSDRQVASLMRLRYSQEMKDVVRACRQAAVTDSGPQATGGAAAPLDSDASTSTAAAAADSIQTSISGSSLCTAAAASAGGSGSVLAVPGMQSRDRNDILGRMDLRRIAAISSHAASALPVSSGAVPLDSGWAADPRRDISEQLLPLGTDGGSSEETQDGDGDRTGIHLHSADRAAGPRQLQQQLDAITRHGLVGLTPSQTMPLQPAKHLCGGGGGSGNGKAGPPAYADGGTTRRAGPQQQTEAKGAGSLAGGLLRLQRRLESLQKSRILRESAAAAAAAAAAAKAGRYVPASGAASHGSSSGAGGDDSDGSRSTSARGTGIGSDGCLYGSGPRSDRVAGAAVLVQPHASSSSAQTANVQPDRASTMLSRSQLGSWDVREEQIQQEDSHQSQQQQQQQQQEITIWQQLRRHPGLSQPEAALTREVAAVAMATPAANTATMASAAASPSAANAAVLAEERLARLRSEFDQLYEGLFSKGLHHSRSAAAAAAAAVACADGGGDDARNAGPQPAQPQPLRPLFVSQQFQQPSVQQPCRAVGTDTEAAAVVETPAARPPRSGQPATTDQMQSPRSRFRGSEPASSMLESYGRNSRDLTPVSERGGAALRSALASASAAKPKSTNHNVVSGSTHIGSGHNLRSDGGGSGGVIANWLSASVSVSIGAGGSGDGGGRGGGSGGGGSGSGGGGGGNVKLMPSSDKAGDRRRPSVAAAGRTPSASSLRHSSEVAWAALPHGGPAQGLYGALLAGYAAQELWKPVAGTLPRSRSARGAGGGGANPHPDTINYCFDRGRDQDEDEAHDNFGGGRAVIRSDGSVDKAIGVGGGAGGDILERDTGEPDWNRLRQLSSGVFLNSGAATATAAAAAVAAAAGTAATPVNAHDSGGTLAGAVSIILSPSNNTGGLEHLLDSSSNSGSASGGVQEAVREEDSDGSAAFGAVSGAVIMVAEGLTGLQDPAWGQSVLREDGKATDVKGGGCGRGELLVAWPSAGLAKVRSRSGTIGGLDVTCGSGVGGVGGVLSSEGSGDDASLGSWNLRIARDAMSIAAALSSPSSQQPPLTPSPPPMAPLQMAPLPTTAAGGGSAASNPTGLVAGTPGLSPLQLGSKTSTADAAAWAAVNTDATAATLQAVSVAAAAAATGTAALPCSGGGVPLPQVESSKTRPEPARSSAAAASEVTIAAASEVPNSGTVPLLQRNQALLRTLERAAAGSEVLQERLYDTQLELMELRTLMEVQQAAHDEEVVRLRRHLRRAALAEAEAEDVLAAAPTGTGGKCGERRLAAAEAAAVSAAMAALMAAYEEDIDRLRRQVADLIAGQRDLAILCAEQDLAALAMDAVLSRRSHLHRDHLPDQHAVGSAVAAAVSTGDGGVASSAHRACCQAAAPSTREVAMRSNSICDGSGGAAGAVADALTTPRRKAAVSPARGRLLAAAPPPSSSSPLNGLQQRRRRQPQLIAEQSQSQTCLRSRSDGPARGEPRRRRHSCGPQVGGASSPFRSGGAAAAGPASPRSRRRLGASADTTHTYKCRHRYPDGADSDASLEGPGGHNGGSRGLEGEAMRGWWFLSGTARGGSIPRGVWPGDSEVTWRRGQKEMGALRSALRQAHRREAQLQTALATAQQQRRAALLQARVAAGEGARRRWLEMQAADLASQLTSARADATAAAASRDAAVRDAQQLLTENQVLMVQLDGMRQLVESFAQLAGRAHDIETNLNPGRDRDPDT